MKFALGYPSSTSEDSFVALVQDYRPHVAEVYFPWPGMASGRAALGRRRGSADWTAQRRLEGDLATLKALGVRLDILFNANCYGGRAVSESLQNEVGSILDHLDEVAGGVDVVTTTSLAVARTVKHYFPAIEVRASVNMRIGTTQAMGYVAGLFDSYYLQRDLQRNLNHLRRVRVWCDEHDKGLCLLANSGCLRHCPGQSFHDNLVAHDAEIDETRNIPGWTPHVCWNLFRDRANWPALLSASWIRPEDLHHYAPYADVIKLATRMHQNPRLVVHAYATGQYHGNLLDLFEPGFGPALAPHILDNTAFPDDWFARTSACPADCCDCGYCTETLARVCHQVEP